MIRMFTLTIALGAATLAFAQSPPATKARGAIAAISGDVLTVAARDGAKHEVRLGAKTRIVLAMRASREDLKPNSFIGVTSAPEGDGMKALEIHVFPEALRGIGEGTRAYDLAPGSTMTNGAVSTRVGALDGGTLTVTYAGGSQTISLPADTPIVAIAPGARDDVKLGAGIVATGPKGADGAIDAAFIVVGKDGVTPPM
jgi:hypothetical protein